MFVICEKRKCFIYIPENTLILTALLFLFILLKHPLEERITTKGADQKNIYEKITL